MKSFVNGSLGLAVRQEDKTSKTDRMAKKKKFTESMLLRFWAGTLARFDAAMLPTEDRAEFIREAAFEALMKREKSLGIPVIPRSEFTNGRTTPADPPAS
jgi:hypothetical protein